MALLPSALLCAFRSVQRHALTCLALPLLLVSAQVARAQATPVVVPGTVQPASQSDTTCFTNHQCGDDGPLSAASFTQIDDIAFDAAGNLYIVDATEARIMKVTKGSGPITSGIVTPLVGQAQTICPSPTSPCGDGGPASAALLKAPHGIAFNAAGDIFISDFQDNRIRRIDHATNIISTYAGNGADPSSNPANIENMPATAVGIAPWSLTVTPDGTVYFIDGQESSVLRAIDPLTHTIRTVNITQTGCTTYMSKVAAAPNGDVFLAVNFPDNRLCSYHPATGVTTSLAGGGSNYPTNDPIHGNDLLLTAVSDVFPLPSGDALFVDTFSEQVFRYEASTKLVYVVAGCSNFNCPSSAATTVATKARIRPNVAIADAQGNIFYTAEVVQAPINEVLNTPATITFDDTAINTRSADSPERVLLMNFGTTPVVLSHGIVGTPSTFNPYLTTSTAGADNSFTIAAISDGFTAPCPLPSATPTPLAAASTCGFDLGFQPTANGVIDGALTFLYPGNIVGTQQVVPLTGKTPSAAPNATATVTPVSVPYATQSITLQASVTYTGASAPTGGAVFNVNGGFQVHATCTGSASPLTCSALYNPGGFVVGSYPINFQLGTDGTYATIAATAPLTITQATAAATLNPVSVTYGTNSVTLQASVAFPGMLPPTGAASFTVSAAPVTAICTGSTSPITCSANFDPATFAVGSYPLVFRIAANGNYAALQASSTFTVTQGPTAPAITFNIPSHTYGDGNFLLAATSNSPGAFTYTVLSGPAVVTANVVQLTGAGSVTIRASQAASGNFTAASAQATFAVARCNPTLQWPTPAAVAPGTILNGTQLNARAIGVGGISLPGTFAYTPASGSAATQPPSELLQLVFTPTDTADYNTASGSVLLPISGAATSNAQDFTLTLVSSPTTTLHVGDSGPYQLRISPIAGQTVFASDVNLSYGSGQRIPTYATGEFSANTIHAGAPSTDVIFKVVTHKLTGHVDFPRKAAEAVLAALLPLCIFRRRKLLRAAALTLTALIALTTLNGCGTGYAANTFTVTITGQSGAFTHAVTLHANILETSQ